MLIPMISPTPTTAQGIAMARITAVLKAELAVSMADDILIVELLRAKNLVGKLVLFKCRL